MPCQSIGFRMAIVWLVLIAATSGRSTDSMAQTEFFDRPTFEAQTQAQTVEDFNNVTLDNPIIGTTAFNQFTVTPGPSPTFRVENSPVSGSPSLNFGESGNPTMTFTFDSPVNAFGFDYTGPGGEGPVLFVSAPTTGPVFFMPVPNTGDTTQAFYGVAFAGPVPDAQVLIPAEVPVTDNIFIDNVAIDVTTEEPDDTAEEPDDTAQDGDDETTETETAATATPTSTSQPMVMIPATPQNIAGLQETSNRAGRELSEVGMKRASKRHIAACQPSVTGGANNAALSSGGDLLALAEQPEGVSFDLAQALDASAGNEGDAGAEAQRCEDKPGWRARGNVWLDGGYLFGETGDRDVTTQFEGDFDGFSLFGGADIVFPEKSLMFGAAMGYTKLENDLSDGSQSDVKQFGAVLYANYITMGGFYANGSLGYGFGGTDLRRKIPHTNLTASADPDRQAFSANALLGFDVPIAQVEYQDGAAVWTVGPFTGWTYTRTDIDGFQETGAGMFNVEVDDITTNSNVGTLGMRGGATIETSWGVAVPQVRIGVEHEFSDQDDEVPFVIPVTGTASTVRAGVQDRTALVVGASALSVIDERVIVSVAYDGRLANDDLTTHAFTGQLRIRF